MTSIPRYGQSPSIGRAEGLDPLVDSAHGRLTSLFEMPGHPHRLHQIVHRAGRNAMHIGLLHHGSERLLGHAAQLQEAREVGALAQLRDALLAAVTAEAERRGRRPPSPAKEKPVADAKPQRRQEAAEDGAGSLTTGKLNAVRAAFKAGVKPSAIARQFGISQSDVRKALAQGTRREA